MIPGSGFRVLGSWLRSGSGSAYRVMGVGLRPDEDAYGTEERLDEIANSLTLGKYMSAILHTMKIKFLRDLRTKSRILVAEGCVLIGGNI